MTELVKISQKAENDYVGVNCGIMDQFAVGMGKANHAIALDLSLIHIFTSRLTVEGWMLFCRAMAFWLLPS